MEKLIIKHHRTGHTQIITKSAWDQAEASGRNHYYISGYRIADPESAGMVKKKTANEDIEIELDRIEEKANEPNKPPIVEKIEKQVSKKPLRKKQPETEGKG